MHSKKYGMPSAVHEQRRSQSVSQESHARNLKLHATEEPHYFTAITVTVTVSSAGRKN